VVKSTETPVGVGFGVGFGVGVGAGVCVVSAAGNGSIGSFLHALKSNTALVKRKKRSKYILLIFEMHFKKLNIYIYLMVHNFKMKK
jgi:hypothetical protein